MRRTLLLFAASLTLLAQAPASSKDPFAPVRFLAGQWEGNGAGAPGSATGAFTFSFELDGKAMVRKSFSQFPAQGGRPAARHEDLMTLFPEGGALRALYVDNEGHVIHYTATATPQGAGAVFLSDPGPGPRFRLTYRATAPDTVSIRFEFAPPDHPEAFTQYLEATSRRKR